MAVCPLVDSVFGDVDQRIHDQYMYKNIHDRRDQQVYNSFSSSPLNAVIKLTQRSA